MSARAVPGAIASISPARRMPSRRSAGSGKAEPRPPAVTKCCRSASARRVTEARTDRARVAGHDGREWGWLERGGRRVAERDDRGARVARDGRGAGWPEGRGIAAAAARLSSGVTADVVSAVVSAASMQVAVPAACPIPGAGFCPGAVAGTDPLLVARRHVDFLRIRSAI
jgi:hypothetical protein